MKVSINQTRNFNINKLFIEKLFVVIKRVLPKFSRQEVSIAFVDNNTIRRLNRTYRQLDAVTDVLAFAESKADNPLIAKQYLGEIVIAFPRAKQQAKKNKHSVQKELVILLVHGFLHLIGFDHVNKKGGQKMKRLESRLVQEFKKMGL